MSKTVVSSDKKEVIIGFDQPFCIIGERINKTRKVTENFFSFLNFILFFKR